MKKLAASLLKCCSEGIFKDKGLAPYIAEQFAVLLRFNRLDSFERLWSLQADWFEPPNDERGGWSGISRIVLNKEDGTSQAFFLKRQQGHSRKTFKHPIIGESTFAREFQMFQHFAAHQVPTLTPVFFDTRFIGGQHQSILMTAALEGYVDLHTLNRDFFKQENKLSTPQKRNLIRSVARLVRSMHDAGVQHRALYPKHLFIKQNGDQFDAVVIDLEKCRFNCLAGWRMIADLATLASRTGYWQATDKMRFYKAYLGARKLGAYARIAARWMMYRAIRKQNSRSK